MERVRVRVHAEDPILRSGVVSQLRSHWSVEVLSSPVRSSADVRVHVHERLTSSGLRSLRPERGEPRRPAVLVVGEMADSQMVSVVECGVMAVVPSAEATGARLVGAVLAVARGEGVMPPRLTGALLSQLNRRQRFLRTAVGAGPGLGEREVEVLSLLAEGLSTSEIAQAISYSERTVKSVVQRLQQRLGLRNRPQAVAYALWAGVI
ncbi:LuxR C-terminal-related transcriptional regulator [Lentzea sp. NPDC058436]|uniref:helix-turn-helix transcriptional regulator n=1 Tax=Lentzea sp. NPDC058436 TaxID=3346499 RepID=UPI00364CC7B3